MQSDLRATTLGSICKQQGGTIQTGPFGSQLHASDYDYSGTPVIMPLNLANGIVETSGIARVSQGHVERLSRHCLVPGDIVFSRRGDVTRFALITERERGWLCGTGCLKVSAGTPTLATANFIAAALALPVSKEWLIRHAVGATMPNLNTGILANLPISLPPLVVQENVTRILGALNDRLHLLRQTSATLEAIVQTLFKSWFIDFDPVRAKAEGREPDGMEAATAALFPSTFEDDKAIAVTPAGWSSSALYDLAQFINGAAYKAFEPNTEARGLPIIKIAELKAGVTSQTAFSEVDMPSKYRIDSKDILFSWSGNPYTSIDTFVWPHGAAWLNQHIFRVVPNAPHERSFVLLTLRHLKSTFAEIARDKQTTGLGHVTVADLKRLRVVKPDTTLLRVWNKLVDPLIERAFVIQQQAQSLAQLRVTLLPRLISGKLRVSGAQALIEEATS